MQFRKILILGGVRSGKSFLAQQVVERSRKQKVFIATGEAHDEEMKARIAAHKASRGVGWQTIEEPVAIAQAILRQQAGTAVLVDCLTLWLSNIMHRGADLAQELAQLENAIRQCKCSIILVSNEVGMGIVPESALGRAFRDWQGRVNQGVARACDAAVLTVAGMPLLLKPSIMGELSLGRLNDEWTDL